MLDVLHRRLAGQPARPGRWLDSAGPAELRQRSVRYQRLSVQNQVLCDLCVVGALVVVHRSGDHRSLPVELARCTEAKAELCEADAMEDPWFGGVRRVVLHGQAVLLRGEHSE